MALSGGDFFQRSRALLVVRAAFLKHWHISFQNAAQKRWFCGALCRLREKPDSWRSFSESSDLECQARKSVWPHATPRARVRFIWIEERTRACHVPARRTRGGRNLRVRNHKITCNVVGQACLRVVCSRFRGWLSGSTRGAFPIWRRNTAAARFCSCTSFSCSPFGLALPLLETSLGSQDGRELYIGAFKAFGRKKYAFIGIFMSAVPFIIVRYYCVIGGFGVT